MKSRPISHKNENTFKFQSFSERLSGINVQVIRRIKRPTEVPDEHETFFQECLDKWTELNLTDDFECLRKEIGRDIQTISQLLLKKEHVLSALKERLKNEQNLALDASLELLVAFARDLQFEVYPYFPDVFNLIVELLETKNTEIIEQGFTALSYLFKFLWRYMVKDMKNVYSLYCPLLSGSRKPYIHHYASESISFLIRKVKSKQEILSIIFAAVEDDKNIIAGTGNLLFEVVKGVNKKFHSCHEEIIPSLMDFVCNPEKSCSSDLRFQVVIEMFNHMTKYTSKENTNFIWSCLFETCNSLKKSGADVHIQSYIVQLVSVMATYKDGKLINDLTALVKFLCSLMRTKTFVVSSGSHILRIASSVLCSTVVNLEMEFITSLLSQVYKSDFPCDVIFDFTRTMFSYGMFQKDVLPSLLQYIQELLSSADQEVKNNTLALIADLILFNRPMSGTDDFLNVCLYPLNFKVIHTKYLRSKQASSPDEPFLHIIQENINASRDVLKNLNIVYASVVCLPHISSADRLESVNLLKFIITKCLPALVQKSTDDIDHYITSKLAFIVLQSLIGLLVMNETKNIFKFISDGDILELIELHSTCVGVLCVASLYYKLRSKEKHTDSSTKMFDSLFPILSSNLSSPHELVRLHTLEILSSFIHRLPPVENEAVERVSVFNICLSAEKVETSLQDYREKVKFLQKLDHDVVQNSIPLGSNSFSLVPLQYLLGVLYINLRLLWEPTMALIVSHATGLPSKDFWNIFHTHLIKVMSLSRNPPLNQHSNVTSEDSLENTFNNFLKSFDINESAVDYMNHRLMCWKSMSKFPQVVELHNRDSCAMFLDFINNELYTTDHQMAPFQNLLQKVDDEKDEMQNKMTKKPKIKLLCTHLEVFSKFHNPRGMYREAELRNLYHEFLTHKILDVQKLGLDCVMSYKYKYLTPYREHLYRLLDDKSFKTEITLFSIDSENSVVLSEHRRDLLFVLMRILYGKMLSKTGSHSSGNVNTAVRKAIILRYLAGTQDDELKIFFDLAFSLFKDIDPDTLTAVKNVKQSIDLSRVTPLFRLQSALNMLGVTFDKLGSLIDQHVPWLLKLILVISSTVVTLLDEKKDLLSQSHRNFLRTLRTTAMNHMIQFFKQYEHYSFAAKEIDAIFEAVINQRMSSFVPDCVNEPAPVLRLFKLWSSVPRYFVLFSKVLPNENATILTYITKLFASDNVKKPVVDIIMNILENLFILEDYNPDDDDDDSFVPEIVVNDSLVLRRNVEESMNYGTILLLPHLPNILKRMRLIVTKASNSSKQNLTSAHITILSRASEHVVSKEDSEELIKLLIMCLKKSPNKSEDVLTNSLNTIANLLKHVDEPSVFLRPLSDLFMNIVPRLARKSLCQSIRVIADRYKQADHFATIVSMVNAWDPKKADEPDYSARLEGFKLIRDSFKCILDDELFVTFSLMVVNSCCFAIRNVDDTSLRDAASFTLQNFTSYFPLIMEKNQPAFKCLVTDTLIPEIRKHLRSKNEHVRHEFLSILSEVVKNCGSHPKLKELTQLINEDHEIDFFENLKHIQIHRRARALERLAQNVRRGHMKFSYETLSAYIMPIVSSFLSGVYNKHNNLIDRAIDVLGVICKYFPWYRYEALLLYYLNILIKSTAHQKTIIKIVVAILNSFHFDLSKVDVSVIVNPSTKVKAETERNEDADDTHLDQLDEVSKRDGESEPERCKSISVELSTRIYRSILNVILPRLKKTLNFKSKADGEHKANKKHYPEDEEVLRVPIALAMVKLLQNLPSGMLQQSLPGILLRLCELLRSRSETIRDTTRETFVKIMLTLGPKYLWYMLREMKANFKRGYQVHVMTYTIHSVLKQMEAKSKEMDVNNSDKNKHLKFGDLDSCLKLLIDVCHEELFGNVSEEKEVIQITKKLKEARGVNSYNLYQIMSKHVSEASLEGLISDMKSALSETHSHKVLRKITECLKHIGLGLVDNSKLDVKSLMIFIHNICHQSIEQLHAAQRKPKKILADPRLQPQDTFIIAEEPKRSKISKHSGPKTNAHVLAEFGLQLFNVCLRKGRLLKSCQEHLEMIDPFVPELTKCLSSKHVKSVSSALRCLAIILKFPLPSLRDVVDEIRNNLFVILNKFAAPGMVQGDNSEMVLLCFEVVTVLIRNVTYCNIDNEKVKVLLTFAEQDMHDSSRQKTAFSVIKAVLTRQVIMDEVNDLMKKVLELSITSDLEHIRSRCRQTVIYYLLYYPLGKKLTHILQFLTRQIGYDLQTGRESVLELLNRLFVTFPTNILNEHSGLFYIPVAVRLLNEESPKCKKMAALVLKTLIEKIDVSHRDNLFNITLLWFKEDVALHRRLAAQLMGLFAEVEKENFESRLGSILPIVVQELSRHVDDVEDAEKITDHLLYNVASMLVKIFSFCQITRNSAFHSPVSAIFGYLQRYILYPHVWVRLAACQLFGLLFSMYDVQCVVDSCDSVAICTDYLLCDTKQKLRDLTADFCTILQSPYLDEQLSEQVIKNLVFLGKVIHRLESDAEIPAGGDSGIVVVSFDWLIKRLFREIKQEVSVSPKNTLKRSSIFKWIAAISLDLGPNKLSDKLDRLLRPLVREITDGSAHVDEKLKCLAQEVVDVMKRIVGVNRFTRVYTEVQSMIGERRVKRKRERVAEVFTDPVKAAERKMNKHMAKRVAKKRKIQEYRGMKVPSKAKKMKT